MFKVKYVDSIMMLVRLDLNLIVSLFQHKCEVTETVSTTTLMYSDSDLDSIILYTDLDSGSEVFSSQTSRQNGLFSISNLNPDEDYSM